MIRISRANKVVCTGQTLPDVSSIFTESIPTKEALLSPKYCAAFSIKYG